MSAIIHSTRFAAWIGLAVALQFLLLGVTCYAGETRSYAIVIGISDYKDPHWPHLPNGRPDAEQMAAVLARQGFQVHSFLDQNATVTRIDAYIEDDLAPQLQSNDRVLFFFSGHGQTRTVGSQEFGYVVPHEATTAASTWISMDKIKEYSQVLNNARHQLFILDSCFSGLLITRAPVLPPETPHYIEQLNLRTARTVITAGGKNQRVVDSGYQHMSLFTYEIVRALQDGLADVHHEGFITVNDIFTFVLYAASTSDQTPSRGTLPGDEGGEMVFTSSRSSYVAKRDSVPPAPGITRGMVDPGADDDHSARVRSAPALQRGVIRAGDTSDDPDFLSSRVIDRLNAALHDDKVSKDLHATIEITFKENVNRRSPGDPRIFGAWSLVVPGQPGCTFDSNPQWYGKGGYGSLDSARDEAINIGTQRLWAHIKAVILGPTPQC